MNARRQVAALPLRLAKNGAIEILLVTSRDTGRWIIPKGWTSKRIKDCKAAAREAREEAGVKGKILREAIGTYRYIKRELGNGALIEVRVFLLKVSKRCKRWPEKRERRRAWFDIEDAASRVQRPRALHPHRAASGEEWRWRPLPLHDLKAASKGERQACGRHTLGDHANPCVGFELLSARYPGGAHRARYANAIDGGVRRLFRSALDFGGHRPACRQDHRQDSAAASF